MQFVSVSHGILIHQTKIWTMQAPFITRKAFRKPMEWLSPCLPPLSFKVRDFLPVFIQMSKSFLHSGAHDDGRWVWIKPSTQPPWNNSGGNWGCLYFVFQVSHLPRRCHMQRQFLQCLGFFIFIYCYSSQHINNNNVGLGVCCLDITYSIAFL